MNYSQIQDRAASLAQFEGWTDVSPAPDWATLVQRAWDQFAWDSECFIDSEAFPTVINQTEYTLTNTYKNILDVTFAGTGLLRSEERFERNLDPSWRVKAAVAMPSKWVLSNFSKISLVPPPNSVQTVTVRGVGYGTVLVNPTDTPSIPTIFHEAIAIKAAVFHGEVYAQGEGAARVARLDGLYQGYVQECRASLLFGFERRQPGDP